MADETLPIGLCLWFTEKVSGQNALRHFMARLPTPRTRFSHASPDTTLHPELTLLDNMLMALEETYFEGSDDAKEAFLCQRLADLNLRSLASWFQNPRRKMSELTPQERLVAAVCHALLKPVERSLIELTLPQLDPLCWDQLQQTINEKASMRHITVQLTPERQWLSGPVAEVRELGPQGPLPRAA